MKIYFHRRWWNQVVDWKDQVIWAFQRAFRGYDDTAYWGLNSYLTKIALPVIKKYHLNVYGYPGDLTKEKWRKILAKMVLAFQLMEDDEKCEGTWNLAFPRGKDGKLKMNKRIRNLHYRQMDEGLKLFAQYYRNLWD